MRFFVLSICIAFVGCARPAVSVVNCDECDHGPILLASGVSVSVTPQDKGGATVTGSYGGRSATFFAERNCDAIGSAVAKGVLIVHDRYASNEDQLICHDLVSGRQATVKSETDGYVHCHLRNLTIDSHGLLSVEQYEYAGPAPDRHRRITIALAGFVTKYSQWENDAGSKRGEE